MSDQFNFWAGWVLKTLYNAHPRSIDIECAEEISNNFWPTVEEDDYFEGLRNFLLENKFIVQRDKQYSEGRCWNGVALTEKGYRTVASLPSALVEKESPLAIGAKVFGPLVPFVGGLIKGASGG